MAVIKTIDLVGVSSESWPDAAQAALAEASKALRGIEGMEVLETSALVEGDKIKEYQTDVRLRFRFERYVARRALFGEYICVVPLRGICLILCYGRLDA